MAGGGAGFGGVFAVLDAGGRAAVAGGGAGVGGVFAFLDAGGRAWQAAELESEERAAPVVSAVILLAADAGGRRSQAAELESEIIKVRPIPDMVHGLMHRKVRRTTKGCGHGKR